MSFRKISRSPWFQRAAGFLAAEFLRLVWLTNRFSLDPQDIYEKAEPDFPLIIAFWHGQHFMMPFLRRNYRAKVLISRHGDGEINAIAAERLGVGTVRGSGDHGGAFHRKGGVAAFKAMLGVLDEGCNMALTADVPKVSRVAGLGIIMLARESGRPILPVAIATSRFVRLKNWDRSVIHLPFGRGVIAGTSLVKVPPDADAATMETLRLQLEGNLNEVTRRAYAIVGRPDEGNHGA
ncbi:MAG: lysophospholipid acyltransferase family protein [Xanthobacteraceae bacterium]|nr:lysophospholipid acyltransferase family protein [Xanthobacteraceae bacterium]